jgi:hypothetical protein
MIISRLTELRRSPPSHAEQAESTLPHLRQETRSTSSSFHAVFALKSLDSPSSIYQALLAGVEGVAVRADLNTNLW